MSASSPGGKQPYVLVVDDDTRNAKLVACSLETEGYRTEEARDGATALASIEHERPDLILLDIMMPGIDGFEVCRLLRADPATEDVPVILFTALNETTDKVRGLNLGADAFISKPIERAELLAHVRTHLRIKQLRDEVVAGREVLAQQNRKLKSLEQMRHDLTHMLVHDLKSPLTAIQLKLELLRQLPTLPPAEVLLDKLVSVEDAANKLQSLVQNILDVARLEEAEVDLDLKPIAIDDLLETLERHFEAYASLGKTLEVAVPKGLVPCVADAEMLSRVLENLITNAIKLTPRGGDIVVSAAGEPDGSIRVTVADRGPGVPDHLRSSIFDKFSRGKTKRSGVLVNHGLGLTFAKLAVEAHGGRIWVESRDGGGSLFHFTVPTTVEAASARTELDAEPTELANIGAAS